MQRIDGLWLPDNCKHPFSTSYQEKAWFKAQPYIRNYDCAIDVGAHVGIWTLRFAEVFEEVFAFEPQLENWECLNANIGWSSGVTLAQCALGKETGAITLENPAPENSGAWETRPGTTVALETLDIWEIKPDLIKIDVQGDEEKVLEGGYKTISEFKPVLIIEGPTEWPRKLGYDIMEHVGKDRVWA